MLVAAAILTLASMPSAHAQAKTGPTRGLRYTAPSSCPTRAEVLGKIEARSNAAVEMLSTDEPIAEIEVAEVAENFEARVRVRSAEERTFKSSGCEGATTAAAFVIALALDEERKREVVVSSVPPLTSRVAAREAVWQVGAGIGGGAFFAGSGMVAARGEVFVELERHRRASVNWLEPSFRVGFIRTLPVDVSASGAAGAASFTWTAARAEACPLRLGTDRFALKPCADVELGTLGGDARGLDGALARTTFWAAIGGRARAELRVGTQDGVRVPWMTLAVEGGGDFPLPRHRYVFLDGNGASVSLYRAPAFAGSAVLSARFHIFP